ncbi:MAG: Na+/H+ antiporter subunit C [Myxococcota bacterium]|nr:Na+/H+ antiporter subunit C [Myxococcota bacterium]
MHALLAVVVGALFACAMYLMLRRSMVKLLIGLSLLGHAANLLLFTASGPHRRSPPIVPEGLDAPIGAVADPMPQALVLTAIVIGFGVVAFAVALVHRTHKAVGSDDLDKLKTTDR